MKSIVLIAYFSLLGYSIACGQANQWTSLPLKFNYPIKYLYVDTVDNQLYMTGRFDTVNNQYCGVVAWDNSQATLMPSSVYTSYGPLIRYQNKLIVEGSKYGSKALCHFDGAQWVKFFDLPKTGIFTLNEIEGALITTGVFGSFGGNSNIGCAAVGDGTNWSDLNRVDTLLEDTAWSIFSLAKYKGELYIVGNMNPIGKPAINEIARFDGQNWKPVGTLGINAGGLAFAASTLVWNNELYVAGSFFERNGAPGNCIAKWDGAQWQRLGLGVGHSDADAAIYDMVVYHDNLYVVGGFTSAGGVSANGIAKWDGKRWCSLGTDFQNRPDCIEIFKDDLYVSGPFLAINKDSSLNRIAKWTGGDYTKECGQSLAIVNEKKDVFEVNVSPVPASSRIMITVNRPSSQPTNIRVIDFLGRTIKSISFSGEVYDLGIADMPCGRYALRAANGEIIDNTSFVKQ